MGNGPSQTAEVPVVSVEIFGDRVFEDPARPAEKIWAYSKWDRQLCGKVRVECSKDTLVLKEIMMSFRSGALLATSKPGKRQRRLLADFDGEVTAEHKKLFVCRTFAHEDVQLLPNGIVPSSIELAPTPSSDEPAFKEFDFAFLTANLLFPSTLSHERLRVHTEIRATVVYAAGSLYGPEEIVTARTVVRTWNDHDLEAMRPPTCLSPVQSNSQNTTGLFPCFRGDISCSFQLPYGGFSDGEYIPVKVNICNRSSRTIQAATLAVYRTITIRASKKTGQEPTGPQPGQGQGQGQTDDPSSPQGQGRSGGQTEGALGQPPDLDTRTADQTGVDQGGRSPGAATTTTITTTTTTTTTHDLSDGRAPLLPAPDQGEGCPSPGGWADTTCHEMVEVLHEIPLEKVPPNTGWQRNVTGLMLKQPPECKMTSVCLQGAPATVKFEVVLTVRTTFCLCLEAECRAPIEVGTRRINRELAMERWNRCAEGCRNYLYPKGFQFEDGKGDEGLEGLADPSACRTREATPLGGASSASSETEPRPFTRDVASTGHRDDRSPAEAEVAPGSSGGEEGSSGEGTTVTVTTTTTSASASQQAQENEDAPSAPGSKAEEDHEQEEAPGSHQGQGETAGGNVRDDVSTGGEPGGEDVSEAPEGEES